MALASLVTSIADACVDIDRTEPPFKEFRAGVGPYGEPQLCKLIAERLSKLPDYAGRARTKRHPDVLITDQWALEFKLARPYGDNDKVAEDWSVNLLHPYPGNTSVFGDCIKLHENWDGPERRASVVIGFEHEPAKIDLEPLFLAFEAIAARLLPFTIGPRVEEARGNLRHPVHQRLRILAWEVPAKPSVVRAQTD